MVTIFINDKRFCIEREVPPKPPGEGVLLVHSESSITTMAAFRSFRDNPGLHHFILVHKDPIDHLQQLKKDFLCLPAGGGLVTNAKGELLVIHRRGKWDLPKGKLNDREMPEEGALREVKEECGLNGLKIEGFLARTWHAYVQSDRDVLKETWWYRMTTDGVPALTPQKEEDITQAKWMNAAQVREAMQSTYSTIKELMQLWLSRAGTQ